jgi:hypothetical protein
MYRTLICWKNFKSKILRAPTILCKYLEPTILNVLTVSFSHSGKLSPTRRAKKEILSLVAIENENFLMILDSLQEIYVTQRPYLK